MVLMSESHSLVIEDVYIYGQITMKIINETTNSRINSSRQSELGCRLVEGIGE